MSWQWIGIFALSAALGVAPGTASAQDTPPTRPVVADCPVCLVWSGTGEIISRAEREIGKLPNGVVILYHADRPLVIEPLIRFAYERTELGRDLAASPELRDLLGGACGHSLLRTDPDFRIEISASAHGFFAILTSSNRTTVKILQQEAKRSVQLNVPVRF